MRKFLILILLLFLGIACHEKSSNKGYLTAILENIPDRTILNIVDVEGGETISRISVFDNKFEFTFNFATPKMIGIWEDAPKYDKYRLILWLENSKIQITGNYDYFVNAKVEGSASNIIHEQFTSLVRKFDNRLSDLQMSNRITNNQNVKDSISKVIERVNQEYKEQKVQFYHKNIDSDVAFYYLALETIVYSSLLDKKDLESLFDKLPEKFKVSNKGEIIKEYISLPPIPKVGEKFIDISQSTPDGKTESISNYLGKFTILEFWASWCGPCRGEHPKLRALYNLYHDRGLNIIGISGDVNSEYWISAIRQDSIPWINISDLRGSNNKAFMIYGVKAIPKLILLDEKGIIIDDELAYKWIESELEKRLK